MNYFQSQANAKRHTGWLVLLFALAVIGLIGLTQLLVLFVIGYSNSTSTAQNSLPFAQDWVLMAEIAVAIAVVVGLASLYKMRQLRTGGAAVATLLGGKLLERASSDLHERKILNVVEEMAIASGVPVPPVYILEEPSINAFAAGHDHHDVAIGITRGAIQLLSRDELQGVVAHEFSHIFNGDIRINLQLMGWLFGILFIGLIGRFLLDSSSNSRRYSRNNKGTSGVAMLGLGFIIIGYVGTFFGKLIKAAISRQREFLADASAVQYTRNPEGIAGALKKIGGYASGSFITHPNAPQASHLFFGEGINALTSMFATHPPLEDRIRAIDARWDGEFTAIDANSIVVDKPAIDPSRVQIVNGEIQYTPPSVTPASIAAVSIAAALDSIGAPQPEHLREAKQRLIDIPEDLQKLARESWGASAIAHCLLLERHTLDNAHAFAVLQKNTQGSVFTLCEKIAEPVKQLPYKLRLPLLDLCLPSLKLLGTEQREQFLQAVIAQINADQHISLFEWSLYRILRQSLDAQKYASSSHSLAATQNSCRTVLSALSLATHTQETAPTFFNTAWQQLGLPAAACDLAVLSNISALDQAVQQLRGLQALAKPRLLKACCAAIADEQQQYSAEAIELLRAVADTLDAPIPPIAAQQTAA
ncbi:MAG: M48 family metallopeptidase [Cellvibrionales bacterium]|jgi:Zn-dependent protease with chaperone function|nr:M48 family metallopeptidase [Cellvibrionales bacterium]